MNTRLSTTKPLFWGITLALLASAQLASAFYDPTPQRWINRDPLAENADFNVYRFVNNEPLRRADVNGLWGIWVGNITIGEDPWLVFLDDGEDYVLGPDGQWHFFPSPITRIGMCPPPWGPGGKLPRKIPCNPASANAAARAAARAAGLTADQAQRFHRYLTANQQCRSFKELVELALSFK